MGVGAVSMALNVLDMSRSMYMSASGVKNVDRHIADLLNELKVLDAIFSESVIKVNDFSMGKPASVVAALERCHTRKSALAKVLERSIGEARESDGIKERIQQIRVIKNRFRYLLMSEEVAANRDFYRSAVLLLQNVVNEWVPVQSSRNVADADSALTHDMLRNMQPAADRGGSNAVDRSSKILSALIGRSSYQEDSELVDEALEHLNPMLYQLTNDSSVPEVPQEQKNTSDKECPVCKGPWRNENAVPDAYEVLTLFNATICCVDNVNRTRAEQSRSSTLRPLSLWYPVRGKYDTGADGDFVALEVLERAKLAEFIKPLDHPAVVTALNQKLELRSKITLTWVLNHDTESEERDFYVAPDADFDILLGNPYLKEHRYVKIVQNNSMFTKLAFRKYVLNVWRDKGM